jgi:TPR repeat protein
MPKDDVEAARWFSMGADLGSEAAQVNLGFMYERGRGGLTQDELKPYACTPGRPSRATQWHRTIMATCMRTAPPVWHRTMWKPWLVHQGGLAGQHGSRGQHRLHVCERPGRAGEG